MEYIAVPDDFPAPAEPLRYPELPDSYKVAYNMAINDMTWPQDKWTVPLGSDANIRWELVSAENGYTQLNATGIWFPDQRAADLAILAWGRTNPSHKQITTLVRLDSMHRSTGYSGYSKHGLEFISPSSGHDRGKIFMNDQAGSTGVLTVLSALSQAEDYIKKHHNLAGRLSTRFPFDRRRAPAN